MPDKSGRKPDTPSPSPDHAGHRDRLRKRLLNTGFEALADYELLELVLFMALPRRDTKPIAKALLERFGSFARVISTDPRGLDEVKGMGRPGVIDTNERPLYIGGADNLVRRFNAGHPSINGWDCYRYDQLPHMEKQQRVALERMMIRVSANALGNKRGVSTMSISAYKRANDRIDA